MILPSMLLAGLLFAQAGGPQGQSGPTYSVSVNLVKVPVSVFDEQGRMVQNLRREDFRVYENGVPQEIRSLGVDLNPVSVVLVLDTSATVEKELDQIKEAAEDFVLALSREDRVCLITFADRVELLQDWTDDARRVRKALKKIEPGVRTALYDAMFAAAYDQLRDIDGRKAIILLTDGLNNQSSVGYRDASTAIVQSQASLYVVSKTAMVRQAARKQRRVVMLSAIYKRMFGEDNYIDEFFRKREEELTDLAEKTGGRSFFPTDYSHIRGVYAEVAQELKSKHFLTYISNQAREPNSFHRIRIEYGRPASKLTYRKGYYYEPRPPVRRQHP